MTTPVDVWFEFASTYSYPAVTRIEAVARAAGVPVRFKPFRLAPIFGQLGWKDSPFNLYPIKGRYMWRDLERICTKLELPLKRPTVFPRNGLIAARATLALDEAARPSFVQRVYRANFAEDREIANASVVAEILTELGHDAEATLTRAATPEIKDALLANTERAVALGIFGAPSLVVGEELFWGNDRVEDAIEWATRKAPH